MNLMPSKTVWISAILTSVACYYAFLIKPNEARSSITQTTAHRGATHSDEAPVVRIANTIIEQAIREDASAIFLDSQEAALQVWYMINGAKREIMTVSKHIETALLGEYKSRAGLREEIWTDPRGGVLDFSFYGRKFDIACVVTPLGSAEAMTLHIHELRRYDFPATS